MNIKKKLVIILLIPLFLFGAGITYSVFNSRANLSVTDQDIAKFVFNAEMVDELEIPLMDLNPGDSKEYEFSITNNESGKISSVTIEYQMILKTYHLIPIIIELYKVNEETEELIMNCDETYTRNEQNEIVCNTPVQEMQYLDEADDKYKLKLSFSNEYKSEEYSNLVDYIDIEIKSWQKLGN